MFVNVRKEGDGSLIRVEETSLKCAEGDLNTEGEALDRAEEGDDSWKADWTDERGAGERSRTVFSFGDGGRGICSGGVGMKSWGLVDSAPEVVVRGTFL